MSTPKALLRALQNQVHQSQLSVDFQAFKGIYNIDDKNHRHLRQGKFHQIHARA